jgi:hypothetical protein
VQPGFATNSDLIIAIMNAKESIHAFTIVAVASICLLGCEKSGGKNPWVDAGVKKYPQTVTLSGSVSGRKGPLQAGKVDAVSENGGIIASAEIDGGSRYTLAIPAGTALPMVLKAYPERGRDGETALAAVAVDPAVKNYDINPLSTAIAEKARSLGGYSRKNMLTAAMTGMATPDANKTTGGFRGDPTKQYGGWH